MRLDLGSGGIKTKAPGHIGIDSAALEGVDIVYNLNFGLPDEIIKRVIRNIHGEIIGGAIEGIRCNQLVEHLDTIIPLMNDCYEVMEEGAILEISTPLAGTDAFYQDPTHKKGYILRTFDYFCDDPTTAEAREEYGITAKFTRIDSWIENSWNLQVRLKK